MEKFTNGLKSRHQKEKEKKFIRLIIIVFIGLFIISFIFNHFIKKDQNPVEVKTDKPAAIKASNLRGAVEAALKDTKGTYGIAILNFKNRESYFAGEHRVFEAGSLYKLWIMAETFQQIQEGKLEEDQVLSEDVATLNQIFNINPDSAELTEGTITMTVRDALHQMIVISHNYAALLLTEKIKLSSVATFLKENSFTESSIGDDNNSPKTTPFDTSFFFEKLYSGKLADQQHTQEMVDLLKSQQLNDGLPKYLPVSANVAHKTGDIDWFKHDAGIVFSDKGDYVITVMSESEFPPDAQERIALISKNVFDYFTNK